MVQEGEEWQLASERAQQQAQQAAAEATRTVAVPKAAAESDTHVTRLPSAMKSASERISLQVRHVLLRTVPCNAGASGLYAIHSHFDRMRTGWQLDTMQRAVQCARAISDTSTKAHARPNGIFKNLVSTLLLTGVALNAGERKASHQQTRFWS